VRLTQTRHSRHTTTLPPLLLLPLVLPLSPLLQVVLLLPLLLLLLLLPLLLLLLLPPLPPLLLRSCFVLCACGVG
jgi:hypothetical protein